MSPLPRPPRRHPRRSPGVHRPAPVAPETSEEVLAASPDVSRETSGHELVAVEEPAPALRKDQVARLEALTAVWERQVRLEGPADATMLYASPKPKPPPPRPREEPVVVPDPALPPDETAIAAATEAARAEEAAETPGPDPAPAPGRMDRGPAPARRRVSDWTSRHDPRSLEYPVRQLLSRPVPLQDVSLDGGPVLDQGTAPPLSLEDASACVGMACAVAAHVLGNRLGLPESVARALYARAQQLDHVHGEDYAGTSVLAGMKAGQEAGLWSRYLWALGGTRDVAQVLLQLRAAVVVGLPWSTGLEEPDRAGIITPGGDDLGGHALAVVGMRLSVAGKSGPWFELQQSRGVSEGIGGRVFLHHRHLARLLAGIGEAGVPLPEELP